MEVPLHCGTVIGAQGGQHFAAAANDSFQLRELTAKDNRLTVTEQGQAQGTIGLAASRGAAVEGLVSVRYKGEPLGETLGYPRGRFPLHLFHDLEEPFLFRWSETGQKRL